MRPPLTGKDPRPYMRLVDALFRGDGSEKAVLLEGEKGGLREEFYAKLYAGLYNEVEGLEDRARDFIVSAVGSSYCRMSGDYMCSVARAHKSLRNW